MRARTLRSTRTYTLFPYSTLCRSDIIRFTPIGVGQQYLGRDLLQETVRDIRAQRIGRALRAENQEGVLLAVGLQAILGKGAESVITQRLPELIDVDHQSSAIQKAVDAMEHVHHDRRANFRIVEEVGHVEAEERRIERHSIDLVRSEERRVGKEFVITCIYLWCP